LHLSKGNGKGNNLPDNQVDPVPLPAREEEVEAGRWRAYGSDELMTRDKATLDIFGIKDESLADSDNLPSTGGDRVGDRRGPGCGAGAVPVDGGRS
jgi:hypothetical protein